MKESFKLTKNAKGLVSFYMTAGQHMVHDLTTERTANSIIKDGKNVEISDRIPDHPVCVDKKYYFAAVVKKPKEKTKKSED
jgi:hypothetical protein